MDMEHWSGFTDVELNSLKQRGRGRRNTRRSRGQPLNQGARKVVYPIGRAGNDATTMSSENIPPGAFFSRETPSGGSDSTTVDKKNDIDHDAKSLATEKPTGTGVEKDSVSTESSGDSGVALTESPPTSLEEMQKQQKLIEELNKKKKAMLQETIQQRYKQTQQESKTLTVVNQELSKLDNMISSEISVLREKIEEANRQYNAARKRFERAEKEYVEAKVVLHHSTEHKELLAEHLCAVIQENEIRKAKKLEELMVKLNLTVGDGDGGSISSKVPVYQRTPTPRYEHWPQVPPVAHSKRDTLTGSQPMPEKHTENQSSGTIINTVTKPDTLHRDSTASSNSSRDPLDSSCDPPDGLQCPPDSSCDLDNGPKSPQNSSHDLDNDPKGPQNSHDPDDGSCDQKNILVNSVHNNSDNSQDLNSQANS